MKFSTKSLLAFTSVAALVIWVLSWPFYTVCAVDCGNGVSVNILSPNESSEIFYHAFYDSNCLNLKEPAGFTYLTIGSKPEIVALNSGIHDLVGLVHSFKKNEILILINTKTGWHWPKSSKRKVDDETGIQLSEFQKSHPDAWLCDTYDGSLTTPNR